MFLAGRLLRHHRRPRHRVAQQCQLHNMTSDLLAYVENKSRFLWPPYVIGQAIYISILSFVLLSFFFFPRLISAIADWMSTILAHMV